MLLVQSLLLLAMSWGAPGSPVSTKEAHFQSNIRIDSAEAREWRDDLHYLAENLPLVHKNAFHAVGREQFEAAVKRLDSRIPELNRDQIIVEMVKIVAMIGDGHTRMEPAFSPKIRFRRFPVTFYFFKDGLFVISATPDYADAVGGRVVKLGRASADELFQALEATIGHESEMWVKSEGAPVLSTPEMLHGLGIIDSPDQAELIVEKDGRQRAFQLRPSAAGSGSESIDMRSAAKGPAPLWQTEPHNNYWFKYLEDSRSVYLKYNVVQNKQDESLAQFFDRVFAFIAANPVDRLIIDLRTNGGGNNGLNWPLIYDIIRSDKINQRGRLFAIIGRGTFSAAQNCVNALERHTRVIFAGEPTGSAPNAYGDPTRLSLPNSGISVFVSTLFWQDVDPRDNRPWTAPEIAAELTSKDYKENNDPALSAVMSYTPIPGLSDIVMEALAQNDLQLAARRYQEYRADKVHFYADTERAINTIGYRLIQMKRYDQAVAVLSWNVRDYPNSANAYDSLAEAYMNAGNKEMAIKNYERAVELNPRNLAAVEQLRKLKNR
jgi:hypothetical protein